MNHGSANHSQLGPKTHLMEKLAQAATQWTGSSWSFGLAATVIIVWAITGPLFRYSDAWQLVINTGTTIVTFLMVFLIQRSQNKESMAVQLKLNELVAAMKGASNRLIAVENLSEEDLELLKRHYASLVQIAKADPKLTGSHSVEETEHRRRKA